MSKYTLTYERNKSQEIYIEKIGEGNNESLYFNQEYDDARKLIREIVELQGTKKDTDEKRKEKREKIKKYGCNNRILFTGQRGCGKTSVMHSLSDYLSTKNPILKEKDGKDSTIEIKFSCLPVVDPSHFDNNNNILLTVITSMFSVAKKKMNNEKDGGDTATREDLLKQFETVFKSLDSIKSELSSYTLESLNRKSDAEDLKDKMKKLVHKYLTFQGCGDESRLVLMIDDIDMSVSYAPEMLEQLRKFLELDNLIILMSANLGQLTNEMREKYSSAFQYTLKDSNQAISIDVEDLATKYLLKLFPTSRRINVERHVDQLLKTNLIVEGWNDKNKRGSQTENEGIQDDKSQDEGDFQKVILSLIWSKTRLLFIPKDPKNTLHPIIPTNLRDLAQFLDMLTSLPNIRSIYIDEETKKEEPKLFAYKEDYEKCEHNLQDFKNYVMRTWIPNHLKVDEELVFHNIPADITEINKHLINSINIIGTKHKDDLMSRQVGLDIIEKNADNVFIDRDIYTMVSPNDPKFVKANKISDIFNQPSNYSYGDLLLMIDKYETYFESEEHRKFTDAIKIYYSILLFETMFFRSNEVEYDLDVFKKKIDSGKDMVIPIQKLIGGNVYYPNYFEIITDKNFNQKGPSYDAKRAFYHKVKVDGKTVGDTYPLFAVLYYGDIRPDRYEKDHIYDTTFEKNAEIDGTKYVTFDILSVLNNMLNPCHTFSRLDNDSFKPEQATRDMIINSITNWGDFIKTDGKSIPGAILPFYAVDVMLNYLQKSISVMEICPNYPNTEEFRKMAEEHNWLFGFESPIEYILYLIQQSDDSNTNSVFNELKNTLKKNWHEKKEDQWGKEIDDSTLNNSEKKIVKTLLKNNPAIPFLWLREIKVSLSNQISKDDVKQLKEYIISGDKQKYNSIILRNPGLEDKQSNIDQLSSSTKSVIDLLKRNSIGKCEEIKKRLADLENDIKEFNYGKEIDLKEYSIKEEEMNCIIKKIASGEANSISNAIKGMSFSPKVISLLRTSVEKKNEQEYRKIIESNSLKEAEIEEIIEAVENCKKNNIFKQLTSREEGITIIEEDDHNKIIECFKIIADLHSCYHQIAEKCHARIRKGEMISVADVYRNKAIALILGMKRKTMSKKEKEALIKDLHKYSSVSEIYKYIIESLWENKIKEIFIRGTIQTKVHSFEVVKTYYNYLWTETEKMFKLIDGIVIDDNETRLEPIALYRCLFEKAKNLFLNK